MVTKEQAQARFIELVGGGGGDPLLAKTLHELVALGADPSPAYIYENVEGAGHGRNATEIAAKASNFVALRFLKEVGVDLTIASEEAAGTPLHRAIAAAPESALALIELDGATDRTNAKGDTPLHTAVRCDRKGLILPLLGAGLNIEARNKFGATPLLVGFWDHEIIVTLLDAGADIDASDNIGARLVHRVLGDLIQKEERGQPRKYWAGNFPLPEQAYTISLLIGRGADMDTPDDRGRIPREIIERHPALSQLPTFRAHMARRVADETLCDILAAVAGRAEDRP